MTAVLRTQSQPVLSSRPDLCYAHSLLVFCMQRTSNSNLRCHVHLLVDSSAQRANKKRKRHSVSLPELL
jgi:hypothetical protein